MAETGDTLTVTDGEQTENATVVNTYSHYGEDVAEVEGDTLSGFVTLN